MDDLDNLIPQDLELRRRTELVPLNTGRVVLGALGLYSSSL